MTIETVHTGAIQENCYVVSDQDGIAVVVDPGDDAKKILSHIEKAALKVRWILITHAHFDHIGALTAVQQATGAKVAVGKKDAEGIHIQPDLACAEGDVIRAGALKIEVLDTPGHTPGGVCYLCEETLFSGDTLFYESIGRTDLAGGDFGEMRTTLVKLQDLPYEDLTIYPGHMQPTTLKYERACNPFMGR